MTMLIEILDLQQLLLLHPPAPRSLLQGFQLVPTARIGYLGIVVFQLLLLPPHCNNVKAEHDDSAGDLNFLEFSCLRVTIPRTHELYRPN
jgi:hypothetical protein